MFVPITRLESFDCPNSQFRLASRLQIEPPSQLRVSLNRGNIVKNFQFNTIVELERQRIKVLFSHENKKLHSTIVPVLKEFLSKELGQEVEVVSKFTAWETLYSATDNVFDLIILADTYTLQDLSPKDLIRKIKRLDQCIPIIQFSSVKECKSTSSEGCFPWPRSKRELKPLTHFFRRSGHSGSK